MKHLVSVAILLLGILSVTPVYAVEKPVVYLTFDDGPSSDASTLLFLDLLDKYNAKATFFVAGYRVDDDPTMTLEMLNRGHALGNHTQNHPDLRNLSDSQIIDELQKVQLSVQKLTGLELTCYRPPYRGTNDRVRNQAASIGLTEWLWTVDTSDYRKNKEIISEELAKIKHQDVVLMHDGPDSREITYAALEEWMLINGNNYRFLPLPGCGGSVADIPFDFEQPSEWYQFDINRFTYVAEDFGVEVPYNIKESILHGNTLKDSIITQTKVDSSNLEMFIKEFYENKYLREATNSEIQFWSVALPSMSMEDFLLHHSVAPEMHIRYPQINGCSGIGNEAYLCLYNQQPTL